jgi:hypothetical protein
MARKARNRVKPAARGQKKTASSGDIPPGQVGKGQFEQDPKRRLGDFTQAGDAHRKTAP